MYKKTTIEERCRKILEDNGGFLAEKARTILLEDPGLKELNRFTEFISKNWRDPLTPALMKLSCEAVGGRIDKIQNAAIAMSLMNLSFYIWDDIIDNARHKSFRPTLFGKFGEGPTLLVGGIAAAKAFSILNKIDLRKEKRLIITQHFWNLWAKMAQAETVSFRLQSQRILSAKEKFRKIETEASANPGTSLQVGAVLGNASGSQVKQLGKYGQSLGVILELIKDFQVSLNLTLELGEKMRGGAVPYSLLWASEHSEKLRKELTTLMGQDLISKSQIKQIIEDMLETETFENTTKQIRQFTEKAKKDVSVVGINYAIQTLEQFVDAQPQLFIERLSAI
jgi:geranylgeranyl diphosphate synthase type I